MTIRCIDIETTGTDPAKDSVVEIGSVDLQRDRTISNQRSALVSPGMHMPAEASAVHHLVDEDLAGAAQIDQVIELFRGADAYVAHNCNFERSFLERYLGDTVWVCTYKCALRLWPDLSSHGNQALRYHFGLINPFGIDRAMLVPQCAVRRYRYGSYLFRNCKACNVAPARALELRAGPHDLFAVRDAPRRAV